MTGETRDDPDCALAGGEHGAEDPAIALKALGHPARLSILRMLAERDRCCAGDFCQCMPLAQSTVSQHLEMLRRAGLVEWRQHGTRSLFTLNRARLASLSMLIAGLAGSQRPTIPPPADANGKAVE